MSVSENFEFNWGGLDFLTHQNMHTIIIFEDERSVYAYGFTEKDSQWQQTDVSMNITNLLFCFLISNQPNTKEILKKSKLTSTIIDKLYTGCDLEC